MHRKARTLTLWQRIALFLGIPAALLAATAGIAHAITTNPNANVGLTNDGVVYECVNLTTNVKTANPGLANSKCPTGTKGLNFYGRAPLHASAVATSHLTNRQDSGMDRTIWAIDDIVRTGTFTEQTVVTADKCGATAVVCYLYTGQVSDVGTFTTKDGATTPGDGDAASATIQGIVDGTIVGGAKFQFYANSLGINGGLVDANQSGATHSTSDWYKQYFVPGTLFGDTANNLPDWSWTYLAPRFGDKWVNASTGSYGNIVGGTIVG